MLVSVNIDAGFLLILPWSVMVVEQSYSLIDLYTEIQDGNVEVLFTSSFHFEFVMIFKGQPFCDCGNLACFNHVIYWNVRKSWHFLNFVVEQLRIAIWSEFRVANEA